MTDDREERLRRYLESRDKALRSQLEPGETVVAAGPHALVTERRVIFTAVFLGERVGGSRDVRDSLGFDEITRWAVGRRHDHRPVLRLEHAPTRASSGSPRIACSGFAGGTPRDRSSIGRPRWRSTGTATPNSGPSWTGSEPMASRRASRSIRLPGTREERRAEHVTQGIVYAGPAGWLHNPGARLRALEGELYGGNNLAWRVRLISWLILAIPAWFLSPWLVLPAIALAELIWIVGLRWSARRDRSLNPSR